MNSRNRTACKQISPRTFLQFNTRNLRSSSSEFKNYITSFYPLCIALNETFLKPNHKFKVSGYNILRLDRTTANGGGLAILIKKRTPYQELALTPYPEGVLEVMAIKLSIDNKWSNILNLYNPCKHVSMEEFDHYFSQLSSDSLVLGDFNAHHPDWESPSHRPSSNPTGRALTDFLISSPNLVLLTPRDLNTRLDPRGQVSTLDLALGSGKFSSPQKVEVGPDIGSDHLPVIIDYGPPRCPPPIPIRPKWIIKEDDFPGWKSSMEDTLIPRQDDTTEAFTVFKDVIIDQSKKHFKLKSTVTMSTPGKPWWTTDCSIAVARRRKARNKLYRYPSIQNTIEHNKFSAVARRTSIKAKRESWHSYIQTANALTPANQLWEVYRSISGKEFYDSPPLKSDTGNPLDPEGIAKKLATHFSTVFNAPTLGQPLGSEYIESCNSQEEDSYNSRFTLSELASALNHVRTKSAHGIDNLPYALLKNLPSKHHSAMLNIMNKSWRKTEIPHEWKKANLITIPKPGKDPTEVTSYRPISLLSCFGKIMERLVVTRLQYVLEKNNLLHSHQFGFRAQRSTLDPLLLLEQDVQLALRSKKVVLAVFFDIRGAFDRVPHATILHKLTTLGIKGRMLRWYSAFLKNREFRVVIDGSYSDSYTISTGVPQGAVSSPTLFNIAMHDIPGTEQVTTSVFADDVSMYTVQESFEAAPEILQAAVEKFQQWCHKWGFEINPEKSS